MKRDLFDSHFCSSRSMGAALLACGEGLGVDGITVACREGGHMVRWKIRENQGEVPTSL